VHRWCSTRWSAQGLWQTCWPMRALVRAYALVEKFELALEHFEYVLREGDDSSHLCKQLKSDFGELYSAYTGKKADWGSAG